jgi:hypothetical protein
VVAAGSAPMATWQASSAYSRTIYPPVGAGFVVKTSLCALVLLTGTA